MYDVHREGSQPTIRDEELTVLANNFRSRSGVVFFRSYYNPWCPLV